MLDPCSGQRQHPPQAASVVGPSALLPWPRSVSCAAYPSRRHSIVPNVPFSPCAAPLGAAARGGPQGARCVPRPRTAARARVVGPLRRRPISRMRNTRWVRGLGLCLPRKQAFGASCERRPPPFWARPMRAAGSVRNATWLILPVVICLSQRLSHACGSIPEREPEKRLPHPRKAAGARKLPNPDTGRASLVPAAAVIPAPIAWTLGWAGRSASGVHRSSRPFCRRCAPGLNWPGRASGAVTLKKLECSKQAYALYTLAWDNIIGFRSYYVGLRDRTFAKDVFINQERKLGARRRSDTVLVSTINDADQGSADVAFRTPPAPYEKSKSLGSGGSMVARLKLKGIDGRAPPGVEPAA
ncbi:UNVERIFIED_CONTAM: hypothetical protein Sindi_3096000 [Sesamum indicum]